MRSIRLFCVVCVLSLAAFAKDPKVYQMGKIVQAVSAPCNAQKTGCQEYVLESGRVTYVIRPQKEPHGAFLPVGEFALYRMQQDKILVRAQGFQGKENRYIVVSMTPRVEGRTADARPFRVNHLQ